MTILTGDITLDTKRLHIENVDPMDFSGFHTVTVRHYFDDIELIIGNLKDMQIDLADNKIYVNDEKDSLKLAQLTPQEISAKFNVSEVRAIEISRELASYYLGCLIFNFMTEKCDGPCEIYCDEQQI